METSEMKIFVQQYRNDMPSKNPRFLSHMLVEVTKHDLCKNIIPSWKWLDTGENLIDKKIFFRTNIREVCDYAPLESTFEPFMRRPSIALHGGSEIGSEEQADGAYRIGWLVAANGFNLQYGGGKTGVMGCYRQGFIDALCEYGRRDDQYSVQIVPGPFVLGVKSLNGFSPHNEGITDDTDALVVMPDFTPRRELIILHCAAAIAGTGFIGTIDELTDMHVHYKTGLRDMLPYIYNPIMKDTGFGYHHHYFEYLQDCVNHGQGNPKVLNDIRASAKPTPDAIFTDLMAEMAQKNTMPDKVHADYCRQNHVSPGVPMCLSKAASADALGLN